MEIAGKWDGAGNGGFFFSSVLLFFLREKIEGGETVRNWGKGGEDCGE